MKLYPGGSIRSPEWLEIRRRVLARDRHRCRFCGVRNHLMIVRLDDDHWVHPSGARICNRVYQGQHSLRQSKRPVRIVLTIAHLDCNPENSDMENLAALCQRCHNRHDRPHRMANAAKTRRAKLASGDLFE